MNDGERTLLVDASVFITLAAIDAVDALLGARGRVVVPEPVEAEISDDVSTAELDAAVEEGRAGVRTVETGLDTAASHLGKAGEEPPESGSVEGDVALLALALSGDEPSAAAPSPVVVTDDGPLRKTCKALSIPVSGSIAVLVRAVERGDFAAEEAKEKLLAMDQVGARLGASLLRRAESVVDDAAED